MPGCSAEHGTSGCTWISTLYHKRANVPQVRNTLNLKAYSWVKGGEPFKKAAKTFCKASDGTSCLKADANRRLVNLDTLLKLVQALLQVNQVDDIMTLPDHMQWMQPETIPGHVVNRKCDWRFPKKGPAQG
jgi:hypothetical protein